MAEGGVSGRIVHGNFFQLNGLAGDVQFPRDGFRPYSRRHGNGFSQTDWKINSKFTTKRRPNFLIDENAFERVTVSDCLDDVRTQIAKSDLSASVFSRF